VHNGRRTRLQSAMRNKSMTAPGSSRPAKCCKRNDRAIGQLLLPLHFANCFRVNESPPLS
jgi:hypothetical protein